MIIFNLKEELKKKDMTLTELAQKTQLSINTLSLLSTGKSKGIQFDTLEKIVNILDCKVEDLIISSEKFVVFEILDIKLINQEDIIFSFQTLEQQQYFECIYLDSEKRKQKLLLTLTHLEKYNVITIGGYFPLEKLISPKKDPENERIKINLFTEFIELIFKKMVFKDLYHHICDFLQHKPLIVSFLPYHDSVVSKSTFYQFGEVDKETIDELISKGSAAKKYFHINDFSLMISYNFYEED
ncbi:helix-turn-helix domain-containing protein [Macrococcoides caseolyticum]|uniref:Helix-turn-helix domain-containing protein n=1 Tax=Macrococcus psychrotolerans TaxID=3039389 RepID=A0AAT9P6I2_9STAP|nr:MULTISPECIES: helix-turn-helix domain-containing protein [Macrococcus]PKE16727.1 hypothetical protein CW718_08095 [Macrococcus caseolyticus]QYA32854.1 helix-turn-helix domain-containing protein [Macrococcus sp. 19Msa1099]QYA37666.1 helix-turn-helix domain-containing protein [Macrococcus caseolyticus]QYA76373.1 helix-turn-helix domain-containing protein [Macrococcus caseolyticus]